MVCHSSTDEPPSEEHGVLAQAFKKWNEQEREDPPEAFSIDSASIKARPDRAGACKKHGPQSIGKSSGRGNTKMHMIASRNRHAVKFSPSPGNTRDALEGRKLLSKRESQMSKVLWLMDGEVSKSGGRRLWKTNRRPS